MSKKPTLSLIPQETIENKILLLRGKKVMFDKQIKYILQVLKELLSVPEKTKRQMGFTRVCFAEVGSLGTILMKRGQIMIAEHKYPHKYQNR